MPQLLLTAVLLLGQADGLPPLGSAQPPGYYPEPNAAQGIVQPAAHEAPATPWTTDKSNSLSGRAPLPLTRPSAAGDGQAASRTPPSAGRSIATVVSSLAIVIGLFFAAMWLMRRGAPTGSTALPSEVVQVLGRAALSAKQQMQLVRIGDKLLLLAVSAGGAQTLTEITDREEVERLLAACEATRSTSATQSFRQILSQLGNEPAAGGFFGRSASRGEEAHA